MKRNAEELAQYLRGRLSGTGTELIENLAELDGSRPGDLSYAEPKFLDRVRSSGASCVLVPESEAAQRDFSPKATIAVPNPKAAFARAAMWLLPSWRPPAGIHPTAIIGSNVTLGDDVHIGAYTVIDDDVEIGARAVLYPRCYVARGSKIGRDAILHANVVLYAGAQLGSRVVLHAGVVVGCDGFGYVRDGDEYIKFPQIGRIVIEDDVEVGANSTLDRGSLGATRIERGTKLDNLVHVAHNVRIGARTVIAAQTGVSGSCDIGDDAVIAGQVGVADHVRIDSGAIVGAQCGIPSGKRLRAGKVFWGTPARPLDDIKVQQAHISRLPRMAEELAQLRERIDRLTQEPPARDR